MGGKTGIEEFIDPIMIILNSLELIKTQYDGVLDENMMSYFNRIERSALRIESLLRELRTTE